MSESRAVRGGVLLDKAPHTLARSGPECAKAGFNVLEERGRVVRIKRRMRVLGRRSEHAKTEGNGETNQSDEQNVSHVPPLPCPPCDAGADDGHSLTNGARMSTPISWPR